MSRSARVITFATLAVAIGLAGLALRGRIALESRQLLDWDETYYASTTATTAAGIGRFPYVLGYPEIPNMGGVGYAVYGYVAAYDLVGPTLTSLRFVAFLASLLGAAGLAVLTTRVYGTAAGLVALAIAASLTAFHATNSIRMDALALAAVAWSLAEYTRIARRRPEGGFLAHAWVGALFGLGLNAHLHTAAGAFAVGLAYAWNVVGNRESRRPAMTACGGYVSGYVAAAVLFLAITVAPSPGSYIRTAALARLSAVESNRTLNLSAPMDSQQLTASFLSPATIAQKEAARYSAMFRSMPRWEQLLWLLGLPACLLLRHAPDRFNTRVLIPGAILGGAIVLNSASPVYFAPLLPFFVPALASLVTHGLSRAARVSAQQVSWTSVVSLTLLTAAIGLSIAARTADAHAILRAQDPIAPAVVDEVKRMASPSCLLAGPTDLYAPFFMTYPRFLGTREAEVLIGSTYLDLQHDPIAYWRVKRPDVVFGAPNAALAAFLREAGYRPAAADVWVSPAPSARCRLSAEPGPDFSDRASRP